MGDINSRYYVAKTVQVNYDAIIAQADERCLFCLTRAQQMALIAIIEPLGWTKRWYSPTGATITKDFVENFLAQLEAELMTDHCDIDAALTTINNSLTTINNDITTINNNLTIVYNTTNVNLQIVNQATDTYQLNFIQNWMSQGKAAVPKQTYLTDAGDTTNTEAYARWCALVTACTRWVKTVVYNTVANTDPGNVDLPTLWTSIVAAGGLVLGTLVDQSILSFAPTISQIIAAGEDSTSVLLVACNLANALANLPPTYANLGTAIAATTYTAATNPYYLQQVLSAWWGADAALQYSYNSFLSILEEAYIKALATNPTDWTCGSCTLAAGFGTVDFSLGQKAPWIIIHGNLTPSVGIESVNFWASGSGANHALASIQLVLPGTSVITHAKFTVGDDNNPEGRGTSGANRQFFMAYTYLLAGVPTRVENSPQSITLNTTTVLDFGAGGKMPILIEFYSKLDVWHHWIVKAELS